MGKDDIKEAHHSSSCGTDKNVCPTTPSVRYEGPIRLKITRRHLPHHTLEGSTYFVTSRVKNGNLSPEEIQFVLNHIKKGDPEFYQLIGAVVMPDHLHLMIKPNPGIELSRITKGLKGATAREINKMRHARGSLWQDESFDRIIRSQEELDEKIKYMLDNPVKKGLAEIGFLYEGCYFKGYEPTVEMLKERKGKP
ncbi:MAG TPA: transposase [bacterium]|nr:transposase [bacterium]